MLPSFVSRVVWIALLAATSGAWGQTYPSKPIRVVTSAPGGGADLMARVVAQGLTSIFGQQAIVDNRGGSVVIQAENLIRALPDGYTMLITGNTIWLLPFLQAKVPYDPVKDMFVVTVTTASPAVLAVHTSVPVNSIKELIALAKAKPGQLNYASGALGSSTHLSSELFTVMAGVNIARIPYNGAGPALNALIAGQVQMMFITASSVAPHVKSGRVKALAVASAEPSPLAPGLTTISAAGLPGYEATTYHGVFVPAKTPVPVIQRLNKEIVQYVNRPEVKEKLFNAGLDVVGSSPERGAAIIKGDMTRMGKVIKDAGIVGE